MNWWDTIRQLDIDISSYCNAGCHSCRRTEHKNKNMSLVHFDKHVWKRLWTEDLVEAQIDTLVLNGNWGDSMMHKDIVEMLQYPVQTFPDIRVIIDTNGGMRNTEFWHSLGSVLSTYKSHFVKFGIDGTTRESNEKYRVDVDYDRVIENALAFIDGGGNAQWVMTVFDHNVDEIHQAKMLAEEYGFTSFRSRKSYTRTVYDPAGAARCTTTCYDERDDLFETTMFYESNMDVKFNEYVEHGCIWYKQRHIQIDPWGYVWPCCHVSGETQIKTKPITDCWTNYGFMSNNLSNNSLQEILEGPYFSIEIDDAIKHKRWEICAHKCGIK